MSDQRTFATWLDGLLQARGLSYHAAAMYIGTSAAVLHRAARGVNVPGPVTCRKIAAWAGVSDEYVLRLAGHLAPEPERDAAVEVRGVIEEARVRLEQAAEMLNMVAVPILGHVHAGAPIETFEAPDGVCYWHAAGVKNKKLYALRVAGDSMVDSYIISGDCVIIDPEGEVRPGKIIIASVRGAQTLKRWGKVTNGHAVLRPANEAYPAITVPLSDVVVLGVVIGVSRDMA